MARDRKNLQVARKADEVLRRERRIQAIEADERHRESQENDEGDVRKKEVRTPTVLKEPNEG